MKNHHENTCFNPLRVTALTAMVISTLIIFPVFTVAADSILTKRPNLDVMKIAHRGAKFFAPENTLPAIEKAIELGFDYIELDIRYTREGIPVCMHDDTVNRTTDGEGKVAELTLDEIRSLDAAEGLFSDPERFKGTKVPTLEEALAVMKGRAKLYMDQKDHPNELAVKLLKEYGFLPDNMVVVGSPSFQESFRKLLPDAPVMPPVGKTSDIPQVIKRFPAPRAFNVNCTNLSEELIDMAHERGVMVFVNTMGWCDQETILRQMIEMGPDAIQTDTPRVLLKTLKKMNAEAKRAENVED